MKFLKCGGGLLAAAALAAGCNNAQQPMVPISAASAKTEAKAEVTAQAAGISDAARAEAKDIFANRCTPCHGSTGGGDGPASAGLTPKPRNFHGAAWQGKVTDEHIEKIIQYGGAAVGLAPMMPANPDLTDKPQTVAALREFIRSLKQQ